MALNQDNKKPSSPKLFLKLFVTLIAIGAIIFLFINYSQDLHGPLKDYPKAIQVKESKDFVAEIDKFIDKRKIKVLIALDKLDEIANEFFNKGSISDTALLDYGYIYYCELSKEASTERTVNNFIRNDPNGAYIDDKDKKYFKRKIENTEATIKQRVKDLKKKYEKGFTHNKKNYTIREIIDLYRYAKVVKDFLRSDLSQQDINEAIEIFKYKTFNNTTTGYGIVFESKQELWEIIKNKSEYKDGISNYYLSNFYFSSNKKYHQFDYEARDFIQMILKQSLGAYRSGYIFSDLKILGVNEYVGKSTLENIDKMISQAIIENENSDIQPQNYLPFGENRNFESQSKNYRKIQFFRMVDYSKFSDELDTYYGVVYEKLENGNFFINGAFTKEKWNHVRKKFETFDKAKKYIKDELSGKWIESES